MAFSLFGEDGVERAKARLAASAEDDGESSGRFSRSLEGVLRGGHLSRSAKESSLFRESSRDEEDTDLDLELADGGLWTGTDFLAKLRVAARRAAESGGSLVVAAGIRARAGGSKGDELDVHPKVDVERKRNVG